MTSAQTTTDPPDSGIPTKCVTCEALQQVPFACEDCHQLLAHVQGADYFELFGMPHDYDLDLAELEKSYLAITRNIHPDKYATAGDEMQAFALRASASVNNAYDVLRDPIHRAEYLLEAAGGPSATQSKTVPQELLNQVMMFREEIDEAKADHNPAALAALREKIEDDRLTTESKVSDLCRNLSGASDEVKKELRIQLNAMKYINNLLAQF